MLAERKVDWKKAYVAYKFELAGEEQIAARYQYLDAFAETWGRTMYGGMTDWCHEHGVKSIGHFMEHGSLYVHPEFCAGDMMRLQKYSDMGGDRRRLHAVRHGQAGHLRCPDLADAQAGQFHLARLRQAGRRGDGRNLRRRGQDLTYPEMKWWADHMQVSGVNFLIPHSFNPRSPYDTDCPPYFYNGGFEPRWPLYRVFADYTSRLSLMLTGGRHVCPVAMLFSGNTRQRGQGRHAGGHDHGPAGRPVRLRLAAVRGVRARCVARRQGGASSTASGIACWSCRRWK